MPNLQTNKEDTIRFMRNTLVSASKQFAFYAQNHMAKDPPDNLKGKANADWAEACAKAVREYDEAT